MTQKELAKRVGVSPMAVSKWMTGGGIGDEKLDEVCEVLGAAHAWLRWGEDAFSDEIWEERSEGGSLMLRNLMNGTNRLDMSTIAEVYLGFVMWTYDCEKRFWHWSSNAPMLFRLNESGESRAPMNLLLDEKIELKSDLEAIWRLFDDLENGRRRSGWGRFTLSHLPGREFVYMARGVQYSGAGVRVVGMVAASGGLVGMLAINGGPRNCYE